MMRLPKKEIPKTWRKLALIIIPLWAILLPLVGLMFCVSFYGYSQGRDVFNITLSALFMGTVLLGITVLLKASVRPLVLTCDGIKIMKGKKERFIAWSDVSHIETKSQDGIRLIHLHLNEWQSRMETLQGMEKSMLIWKNFWVLQSGVNITSMHLDISHKELIACVEDYFRNSKSQS